MDKKVSVIIPCYNQAQYVSSAIESALNQTYQNIEIVCINDGSDDNSSEIIKDFSDKYSNILFIDNKTNNGVISARNTAIEASHGEYILPLDADDIIEPTYIEKAVKILNENPKIGIVYCKAKIFGNKEEDWDLAPFNKSDILYCNCIFCSALFRKSDFIKAGMYKENMSCGCEDHDLWLSFVELGLDAYRIDEFLFNYRKYNEGSRTSLCSKNQDKVWTTLIKNHLDIYLNDKQFVNRLIFNDTAKLRELYHKYKNFCKIFLSVILIETIVLFALIIAFVLGIK